MKWFRNLKISQKLTVGFLIVAIITAGVGTYGIIYIDKIKNADTELYEENAIALKYAGFAAVSFQQLSYHAIRLTTTESTADISKTQTVIDELKKSTGGYLIELRNTTAEADVLTILDEIDMNWVIYQKSLETIQGYMDSGLAEIAASYVPSILIPNGDELRDEFLSLLTLVSDQADSRANSNVSQARKAKAIMIVVIVLAVIVSLLLGRYISLLIGRPLKKMASAADRLAIGDVNVTLDIRNNDELGSLAQSFGKVVQSIREHAQASQQIADGDLTTTVTVRSENDLLGIGLTALVENLHHLILTIATASEQVLSGATFVSNSSTSLSQGATMQASAVQELTASLEEIAAQTNLNAQNAEQANELAKKAKHNAAEGNEHMKEMLGAMDEINNSSANINKIIKVIDDIAFQTNILALNAAVEAARAGQHGKGFAVVAEEVRTLAAKSANAVKETTVMIENSIKKVEAGTRIAGDTAEALNQIVGQIEKAAELVEAIAAASNEQAFGIRQVNQGVLQVSQVVQTNAATSEESAAASEELASQAAQLKETVSIFKTDSSSQAENRAFMD